MAACHLMFPLRLRRTRQSVHTSGEQSFHTPLGGKFPYLYRVKVSIPLLCHFCCLSAPDSTAWLPMPSRSRGKLIVIWGRLPHKKNISHCHSLVFSKAIIALRIEHQLYWGNNLFSRSNMICTGARICPPDRS